MRLIITDVSLQESQAHSNWVKASIRCTRPGACNHLLSSFRILNNRERMMLAMNTEARDLGISN